MSGRFNGSGCSVALCAAAPPLHSLKRSGARTDDFFSILMHKVVPQTTTAVHMQMSLGLNWCRLVPMGARVETNWNGANTYSTQINSANH
jgi:hypothetical protein